MPGLSQLKKFNADILSLGDEVTLRASRGERPVEYPIPKEIEDKDDSEEFVLGMPEIEAEVVDTQLEEDLSDITGLAGGNADKSEGGDSQPAPSFEAPDLSSLLNPINIPDDASAGEAMPDLSMFMEPEEEEVFEEEQEPEEVSVADMGLEALLAGAGFDEPEQPEEEEPDTFVIPDELKAVVDEPEEPAAVEDIESLEEPEPEPETEPVEEVPDYLSDLDNDLASLEDIPSADSASDFSGTGDADLSSIFDDLGLDSESTPAPAETGDALPLDDLDSIDIDQDLEAIGAAADDSGSENFDAGDFNLEAPLDFGDTDNTSDTDTIDDAESLEDLGDISDLNDIGDSGDLESVEEISDIETAEEVETPSDLLDGLDDLGDSGDSGDSGDLGDLGIEVSDFDTEAENAEIETAADTVAETAEEIPDLGDLGDFGSFDASSFDMPETAEAVEEPSADDFDAVIPEEIIDDTGADLSSGEDFEAPSEFETGDTSGLDDFGDFGNSGDFGDLGNIDFDAPVADGISEEAPGEEPVEVSDGFEMPEIPDVDSGENEAFSADGAENIGLDDFGGSDDFGSFDEEPAKEEGSDSGFDFGIPDDFDTGTPSNLFDSADMEIPDYGEEGLDSDTGLSDFDSGGAERNGDSIEQFDTSAMEGLDFDLPETDAQLDGASQDFDLGNSEDFPMEGSFEIPGFSDVQTAKEEKSTTTLAKKDKSKKAKKDDLDVPDFEGAIESEKLPPNTLSDAQYKQFLKNLSEYPLNVRLAFENLIVQDEFTDDAEFEIIEKILEKAPARSVASMLEKMLDISIPVPRDFEHRTAEEYEAYKKSLSYQLKNKIIPGALCGILMLIVGWGLFNFGKNCIYIPAKASSLYKQGYNLLEASEYPQSEMKFEEAVKYRLSKKWFFNYARGYRRHKQYQRSEQMYTNILRCFNHDKAAGLEYAQMELDDLANYEKAEEIVRREVLDYHINDADGILLLGDVFLEWGTEKDPEKLESAREQYATLIQLYNANDLYLSRMMRYFVRTDNLREVLQLKQTFEPREKSLSADDWTELSGYLLDKSYGPIAPSEEYLRYQIEGLRKLLLRAAHANPANPIALYNLSRYFVQTNETGTLESTLQDCIAKFNALDSIKRRDIYKYIDSYRLLGEYYIDTTDYLQALEQFAEGIHLYTTERDNAGFEGTPEIGKLYENFGDIKYFISGDYDEALENYKNSVELENDSPEIRYRIGYIQYKNKKYQEALGSFMKAGEGNVKERNLLLAMANTLSLRGDDYAAEGYFEQLLNNLDREIQNKGIVLPQTNAGDYDVVNTYLTAANNYGVTLYRLAKRTGNSGLNAQAIVQFSQSVRAWDALTRNQESMVRLGGSNLAEQNILYITHSMPEFEPSIYIDIKKTLTDSEGLK